MALAPNSSKQSIDEAGGVSTKSWELQRGRFTTAGETHNVQTYERPYAQSFGRAGVRDSYRDRGAEASLGFGSGVFDRPQ